MKMYRVISLIVLLALALSLKLVAQPTANPQRLAPVAATQVAVATNATPLWLGPQYQTPAESFDSIQGYPWKDVPRGLQTFGNVPLNIGGMICVGDESKSGLRFPEQALELRIGQKCKAIYLYHTAFSKSAEGAAIVQAVFRYQNGVSVTNDISYGVHVRDWYLRRGDVETLKDANSKMVWRGVNSTSRSVPPSQLRFFITEIVNQHPEVPLLYLDLYSARQKSTYCLLAITTGPAGLLKVEPAIEKN